MIKKLALFGLLYVTLLTGNKIQIPVENVSSKNDPYFQSLLERSATTPSRVNLAAQGYLASQINLPETLRVLAIRVEFPADDDSTTWGNGKMDLKGYGSPSDGLLYDPPHDKTYFENLMLGLRNYYLLNSRGRLILEYDVYPKEPFGAYAVPQKMAYYGDSSNMDRGLTLFMRDALLAAADDPDIDFSKYQYFYSLDTFDMIVIFHAGSTTQSSYPFGYVNDLASATITPGALDAYTGKPYVEAGGVNLSTASILPESPRAEGYMTGLSGLLYHEFTHLLGGYDLYDVSYYTQGMGSWALMGTGGWLGYPPGQIPSLHDPYHRLLFGWEDPVIVTRDTTISLYSAEFDTLQIDDWETGKRPTLAMIPIRVDNSGSPREYFLIENRQSTVTGPDSLLVVDVKDGVPIWVDDGEYDAFQPGAGIVIWHVDEDVVDEWGYANYINSWTAYGAHNAVDMEEADGIQDYELMYWEAEAGYSVEGSKFDPFFAKGGNATFGPETKPSTEGYYGETGIRVTVLDTADTVMRVEISFGDKLPGFPQDAGYLSDEVTSVFAQDIDKDWKNELLAFGTSDVSGEQRLGFAWNSDGSAYGTSGNAAFVAFGDQPQTPAALGDVDADGKIEVVLLGVNGLLSVYEPDILVAGSYAATKPGFPVNLDARTFAPLMLADIDGNDAVDILAADEFGKIYAYDYHGELLDGFPIDIGEEVKPGFALLEESPARFVVLSSAGRLYGFDNKGKTLTGFPLYLGQGAAQSEVPPMVADIDGDGEREIIAFIREYENYRYRVISMDGIVKYNSSRLFPSPVTTPALADLDSDGLAEVLFGAANGIWALDANGAPVAGYPVVFPETYDVQETHEHGGLLYFLTFSDPFFFTSSPVVGDIDGDGELEIAIGSPDKGVYLIDAGAREPYKTLYTRYPTGSNAALALADLDGDGKLELIAGTNGGKVHVWRTQGSDVAWGQWMHDAAHTGLVTKQFKAPPPPSSMLDEIYIYPNPAREKAYLHALIGDVDVLKVQLIDISGKLLETIEPSFYLNSANDVPVDKLLEDATPGLYIVRVEATKGTSTTVELYKLGVIR